MDVRPQQFCKQIRCDRCGCEASVDDHAFHLFASLDIDATWGSELGDGNHVEVDLCHSCIKDVLGPWLRISAQGWAKSVECDTPLAELADPAKLAAERVSEAIDGALDFVVKSDERIGTIRGGLAHPQDNSTTVEGLIRALQEQPRDAAVLVQGYETGWDAIHRVASAQAVLNPEKGDWHGEFELVGKVDPAIQHPNPRPAVLLVGRRAYLR